MDHRSTAARRRRFKQLGRELVELTEELADRSDRLLEAEREARVGRRSWRLVELMKREVTDIRDEVMELGRQRLRLQARMSAG